MNCPRCGAKLEKGWEYCPKCGNNLKNEGFRIKFNFGDIFKSINREMEKMNKSMENDLEAFDISPFFSNQPKVKKRGFSIRITRTNDDEPKFSVRTFGDVDKEKLKEEVMELAEDTGVKFRKPEGVELRDVEKKELPIPRFTEEPKANVKKLDSKVLVEIDLPGVKVLDDIRITELESSVEVKAVAGDKAYFKILTKPEQFRITQKKFDKGKLVIEFS
jgi:HSP20 family molecular chaperone IbpA